MRGCRATLDICVFTIADDRLTESILAAHRRGVAVRIITDEELEQVWSNKEPAKAGLDQAVSRGNAYLNANPAMRKAQPF